MRRIYLYLLIIAGFVSCNSFMDQSEVLWQATEIYQPELSEIPYASPIELQQFASDNEVVDYNVARALASSDMRVNNRYILLGLARECNLSQEPVILYGFDNKPEFYDFIIIDKDNKEVGTVTTPARKNNHEPTTGYSYELNNYKEIISRNSTNNSGRIFVDRFSFMYVGAPSKSGETTTTAVDVLSGEVHTNTHYQTNQEILEQITSPQSIETLGESSSMIENITEEYYKNEEMNVAYWMAVDGLLESVGYCSTNYEDNPDISTLFDEFVRTESDQEEGGNSDDQFISDIKYKATHGDKTYLTQYNIYDYRNPRWYSDNNNGLYQAWCGAWVANAIISVYNGKSYYTNDADNLNHYSKNFWKWIASQFNNFMHPYTKNDIIDALEGETNGEVTMSTKVSSSWDIFWHVQEGLPTLKLIFIGWRGWHWTLVYGTRREKKGWFGAYKYYFVEADNGGTTLTYGNTSKYKNNDHYHSADWAGSYFKVLY